MARGRREKARERESIGRQDKQDGWVMPVTKMGGGNILTKRPGM